MSDDGLTYTFHLRKGVKWQDKPPVNGRELVAADVKFTFDRLFEVAKYLHGYQLGKVVSTEALDKYTVVFTMAEVYPPSLTHLASYWATILPHECDEEIEEGFGKVAATIGPGPFMLDTYQPNVKTVFKRSPTYFRSPLLYIDGVTGLAITDRATREAALRAGNIDLLGVDATSLESMLKTNPDLQLSTRKTPGGWAIAMTSDKPPFDDVGARQAVSLAINHEEWNDTLHMGQGMAYSGQWTVLDPDLTLWGFYYPGQLTNISCVDDPKLNAILEEQRRLLDFKERKKVVDDIQRYLSVQLYRISAPYPHSNNLVQP